MLEAFFLEQNSEARDAHWQKKLELAALVMAQNPLRAMQPDLIRDRARLDLMWNGKQLGIRGPSLSNPNDFEFFAIENPDTPLPGIVEMMGQFVDSKSPLQLGQVRFRTNESGSLRGIWIDTSNEQIKMLLEQKTWLEECLALGWVVEAGQKGKEVVRTEEGALKLESAGLRPWLSSYDPDGEALPVSSKIAHFSQPGPEANRALLSTGFDLLDDAGLGDTLWAEWGAGYGNLTAGFSRRLGSTGWASEMDAGLVEALEMNRPHFFPLVETSSARAEKGRPESGLAWEADLWLLDPPRPGFASLLATLRQGPRPNWVLIYHCAQQGLEKDVAMLRDRGFGLVNWSAIDNFPATPHLEVVSLWKRQNRGFLR